MIAMQYTIRLARDFNAERIHDRVNSRSCLFDDLPGLVHKSFLFNEEEGLYAPFYVWEGNGPARDFLTGPLFEGLVENFGRPRVRCWTVLAFGEATASSGVDVAIKEVEPVSAETKLTGLRTREIAHHEAMLAQPGIGCHLVGLDADRWELMRYSTWRSDTQPTDLDADLVEHYDVLHLCRPVVSA
jgi:hypothetical protein